MAAVPQRVMEAVDRETLHGAGHQDDGDALFGRGIRIGPAHHTEQISTLAVPARGAGYPLLGAVDHPVIAIQHGLGPNPATCSG
ncbi:hypothetical protein D3C81_1936760 [compost metagenome]